MRTMRCVRLLFLLIIISTCKEAQSELIIKDIKLSVQPEPVVERGTDLTLTCDAKVIHDPDVSTKFQYNFYKDFKNIPIHMVQTSSSEKVTYFIAGARASHSGTYRCEVMVDGQPRSSDSVKITVRGVQIPVLTVDKFEVTEGATIRATCRAQGESGSLIFSFKDGEKELHREESETGEVQRSLQLNTRGMARLSCSYVVIVGFERLLSNISNVVSVNVLELGITPTIKIVPSRDIIEGDIVNITCTVDEKHQNSPSLTLHLARGSQILQSNMKNTMYTAVVKANDSGEYDCNAQMNNVPKTDSANLTVKELFSQPVLTITPAAVFEKQQFTVTCQSSEFAAETIRHDVKYSIYRNNMVVMNASTDGTYIGMAGTKTNGDYMCVAEVNGIRKWSRHEPFRAKVLASRPIITVFGQVVLDQPFLIKCHSESGSYPITYTLKYGYRTLNHSRVENSSDQAIFTTTISSEAQIHSFSCEAQNNGHSSIQKSQPLSAPVVVPVGKPILTVVPNLQNVVEHEPVHLICTVRRGTPPITFKFYHNDNQSPLDVTTVMNNFSSYTLPSASSDHDGRYYCEALNDARTQAISDEVTFTVQQAMWKKGLIGGVCVVFLVVVIALVIYFRAKRGKREATIELSVKPASAITDDDTVISYP